MTVKTRIQQIIGRISPTSTTSIATESDSDTTVSSTGDMIEAYYEHARDNEPENAEEIRNQHQRVTISGAPITMCISDTVTGFVLDETDTTITIQERKIDKFGLVGNAGTEYVGTTMHELTKSKCGAITYGK